MRTRVHFPLSLCLSVVPKVFYSEMHGRCVFPIKYPPADFNQGRRPPTSKKQGLVAIFQDLGVG